MTTDASRVQVSCGGTPAAMAIVEPGQCAATLHLPNVAKWWPHTHGEPVLHDVAARIGDELFDLTRIVVQRQKLIQHAAEPHRPAPDVGQVELERLDQVGGEFGRRVEGGADHYAPSEINEGT